MVTPLEYAQANRDRFLSQWEELVRIPSVGTDPLHKADTQRAAEWLADDMRRIGLNNVEVSPTGGNPVVYGEWLGAGANAPTVLIYAHYDVQPAIKEDGWDTEPFEPTRKGDKIYARGISDDKSHSVMVLKAAECYLKSDTSCPINLKFVLEGEEESGSPNLPGWVHNNTERLKADYTFIADGGISSPDKPDITYALRGILAMEFTVHGPKTDLHSGMHGGRVHNPAQVVAEMVAKLHTEDGKVAVPGFYNDVRSLTAREREELNKGDLTQAEWDHQVGAPQAWGEAAYSLVERATARPTLEINGIYGGYSGLGTKTVIPAKASAKITCRLVDNQNPDTIVTLITDYLHKIAPPTVTLDIKNFGGSYPVTVAIDSVPVKALAGAFRRQWEVEPTYKRSGGSIPIVGVFQQELKTPSVLLGFGLPDAGIHGPNENYDIGLFHKGLDTLIVLFSEMATAKVAS
jgi:acetylornithine deacetylase/succinyl-diaminopimelate desuccinylase-like protein